jgi:hypothetical protein
MMKMSYFMVVIELALIGLMGLCAVLAFFHSNAGIWLQEWTSARSPGIGPFFAWIIWGLLFIAGVGLVVLAGSSGKYAWLTVFFTLPSLLGFDSINLLKIIRLDLPVTTTLTFFQALVIGITIMTCYILLNRFCTFKKERNILKKRGAGIEDIEKVYTGNYLWLWVITASSILIVAAVALLSTGLSTILVHPLSELPWNIVLAGIVCILILALYLYWLGLRRNSG